MDEHACLKSNCSILAQYYNSRNNCMILTLCIIADTSQGSCYRRAEEVLSRSCTHGVSSGDQGAFTDLFTYSISNFNHPNIVKVLGVCVENDPVYIIMELMPGGDLLHFLRDARVEHVSRAWCFPPPPPPPAPLSQYKMLRKQQ